MLRVRPSTQFCIQELHASFPGLIAESLRLLKPQIGVVTTVGSDHYTNYRSLEATAREKSLLVERLPQSGVAILNIDDPLVCDMARRARAQLITFGLSPQADLRALEVSGIWPDRLSMTVIHMGETVHVETKLVGEHWATSVLAAVALGIVCGVDLKACAQAVKTVEPVFGRYSVHTRSDGASYVLDSYKAPYWTIAKGLAFVRHAAAPRKTIVLGTISDYPGAQGSRYRRVARDALDVADRIVFVGPNSGHIDRLRKGEARDRLFGFQTSYEASAFINSDAIPGELIYVKAGITDHLERVMLSQLDDVVCWREQCGRLRPCMDCSRYHHATMPPFGLGRAHAPMHQVPI
jgi:UDP-N-acetylmuramoyl-tripeptide--D-alanyl-D-alanine ligase